MTLDELYDQVSGLSNDEARAYAREMCTAEGGEWCILLEDLGGGSRSLNGTNKLGAVTITGKRSFRNHPAFMLLIIGLVLFLIFFAIAWLYKKINS